MGCDIHMYIEYKRKDNESWSGFGGCINPGRNYFMFGLLAQGIRSENKDGIHPKGIPDYKTLGYRSRGDLTLFVDESANVYNNYISPERAQEWVDKGYTTYTDESKKWVFDVDAHSHSWLTTAEYATQLDIYAKHPDAARYTEPEYTAVLASMQSFENDGFESRIVFWFDN